MSHVSVPLPLVLEQVIMTYGEVPVIKSEGRNCIAVARQVHNPYPLSSTESWSTSRFVKTKIQLVDDGLDFYRCAHEEENVNGITVVECYFCG